MSDLSYKQAGVDIERADAAVAGMKSHVETTHTDSVLKGLGFFSGLFRLDTARYQHPVLVSSIDGVGTKVKIAEMVGVFDSIGADMVNHCLNDIAVSGADPLFFLDYIAADKLDPIAITGIVSGMAAACKSAGCALIGGETAEMPGVYRTGSFDVAGAIVGVVEEAQIIDGSRISAGDLLLAIPSNGIHTNGFSLVRKLLFEGQTFALNQYLEELRCSLAEELLRVHKSYLGLIQQLRGRPGLTGISHVTGGGIVGNTRRLLRKDLSLEIDWTCWEWPPVFRLLQRAGAVSEEEMRQVFNLGVGLILVVQPDEVESMLAACARSGEQAQVIGSVVSS